MESNALATASLTIIVDKKIEKLDKVLGSCSSGWDTVSVGQEVSTLLVAQNESEYAGAINRWIDERFRGSKSDLFLCHDVDLLFYPALKLDPLTIFRQISRHKKLLVLWPGTYQRGILCYAQPEHSHYRCWRNLEGIDIKGADNAL